ncbi:AAA family ATPase [uncultured Thiodictyon sp.]|uniref:AAA family ATPase n=1 Tax=uncultured Thiodictyon sp. TaxID=1846217 RepID=UPI0025D81571|nr:AAA family ATPase [uncultured Thiodictyon sp.]
MAARRFVLPNIEDLSKDQERVRLLPKEGCHLIVGGPGTGKSVIALLRARQHHRAGGTRATWPQDYCFLAYNKLLIATSRELMGGALNAQTWITWFKRTFEKVLQQPCPTRNGDAWALDWQAISQAIGSAVDLPLPASPFLIIDEGQDMPPTFYAALLNLGYEHVFVVADQNQQITDQHSTVRQIADALDIGPRERITLSYNHRNAYPIARLALSFCVGDPASPCTQLPPERASAKTPELMDYGPGCECDFDEVVRRVLKAADGDPARLLGVITPDNETRNRWLDRLRSQSVALALDHGTPRIVTFATGEDRGDLSFCQGGIFVINDKATKGLEFDWVILADIHRYRCNPEKEHQMDDLRRRFYVMVSRAREQVILLRQANQSCPMEAILPQDPDILRRWGRL